MGPLFEDGALEDWRQRAVSRVAGIELRGEQQVLWIPAGRQQLAHDPVRLDVRRRLGDQVPGVNSPSSKCMMVSSRARLVPA